MAFNWIDLCLGIVFLLFGLIPFAFTKRLIKVEVKTLNFFFYFSKLMLYLSGITLLVFGYLMLSRIIL